MHFVFNSICVALYYFVSRPEVFQLVPWQSLTQVVRLFFAVQLLVIHPLFWLFRCFIRRRSQPRVKFFDLASHRFQFGFASRAAFPFYSSSYLQLFGFFFIHSNTVNSCLQDYYTFFLPQKYYISFRKKKKL